MRPMGAALAVAAVCPGSALAADAGSALRPVSSATFAADAKACVGATRDEAATEARFAKSGWGPGTLSGGSSSLRFYGKDGIMAILSPDAKTGRMTCVEMARLAGPVAGPELIAALTASFGVKPFHGPDGQQLWLLDGEVAGLSGNDPKAPTQVRVVVAPNEGKTQ